MMNKRIVCLIMAGCLVAGALGGCGAKVREDAPPPSSSSSAAASSSSSSASSSTGASTQVDVDREYKGGLRIDDLVLHPKDSVQPPYGAIITVDETHAKYDTALANNSGSGFVTDGTVTVAIPFYNRYDRPLATDELIDVKVTDSAGNVLPCVYSAVLLTHPAFTHADSTPLSDARAMGGVLDSAVISEWASSNYFTSAVQYDGVVVDTDAAIINPSLVNAPDAEYFYYSNSVVAVLFAKFEMADPALDLPSDYKVVVTDRISDETFEITKAFYDEKSYNRS